MSDFARGVYPFYFEITSSLGLQSRDLAAISPTGTGKTLSYLLPIMTLLKAPMSSSKADTGAGIRAIVLAPTRELAHQIYNECLKLAQGRKWRIVLFSKATAATLVDKVVQDRVGAFRCIVFAELEPTLYHQTSLLARHCDLYRPFSRAIFRYTSMSEPMHLCRLLFSFVVTGQCPTRHLRRGRPDVGPRVHQPSTGDSSSLYPRTPPDGCFQRYASRRGRAHRIGHASGSYPRRCGS